jgi:hypothetical protein
VRQIAGAAGRTRPRAAIDPDVVGAEQITGSGPFDPGASAQRPSRLPARLPVPRRDRCTLRYPSSFLLRCHDGTMPPGRVPRWESSLAFASVSPVAPYCNFARFRRGATELRPSLPRSKREAVWTLPRRDPYVVRSAASVHGRWPPSDAYCAAIRPSIAIAPPRSTCVPNAEGSVIGKLADGGRVEGDQHL